MKEASSDTGDRPCRPQELTLIRFHDCNIEAAEVDGTVWVSVERMCWGIGIGVTGQIEKLSSTERCPWAVIRVMRMVAEDGKLYDTFCLNLDSVPMWLATIDVSRVSEARNIGRTLKSAQKRVALYQREVTQALRDHFLGTRGGKRPLPKLLGLSKAQFIQAAFARHKEYYVHGSDELCLRYAKSNYHKAFFYGERGGLRPEGDADASQIAAFLGVEKAMVGRLVGSLVLDPPKPQMCGRMAPAPAPLVICEKVARGQKTVEVCGHRVVGLLELSYELYVMAKLRRELIEDSDREDRMVLIDGGGTGVYERIERGRTAISDRLRAIKALADARHLNPSLLALKGFPRASKAPRGSKAVKA